MSNKLQYKRVLLKISGESLMGSQQFGWDNEMLDHIAKEVKKACDLGAEIAIVIGGGNICRGSQISKLGVERHLADNMGMLSTVINALSLSSALGNNGIKSVVMSAIEMPKVCESYYIPKALHYINRGNVAIIAGGTGCGFFTTDTAGSLRASEMHCDAMFKATKVSGIYDKDPIKFKDAKLHKNLTYKDVIRNTEDIKVMDTAAVALAQENKIPVVVFSIYEKDCFVNALKGEGTFTTITE